MPNLVIVESPAKARTIGRLLGDGYVVKASMGHVRDLPEGDFGVDVENDFNPTYVRSGRANVISDIKKAARQADDIFLATDPDREGEAIAWHLVEEAGLGRKNLRRVVFHEITGDAIQSAFAAPTDINIDLVNAQQARRILDRIVGYRLSPVLWKVVPSGQRRGLSAGRVQSVALKLMVEREREIEAFEPQEYWSISAQLSKVGARNDDVFVAKLHAINGQKGRLRVGDAGEASRVVSDLEGSSFVVTSVANKEVKTKPSAPFTTSTLQQEAARRFGFSAVRTMRAAQQLYEGIQAGGGDPVGLITYMRTDSTSLSAGALEESIQFIRGTFGSEYAPIKRTYRTRSRSAQEAHEAIRPVQIARKPEDLRQFLNSDQIRLYELIWKRMVASQMADAISDSTTVDIGATGGQSGRAYTLRVSGNVLKFPGFRKLYLEARDDDDSIDDESKRLVPLDANETLNKLGIESEQRFTKPPPRFSEAMLIRLLEEKGIGRPSTYTSIISANENRKYVERETRRFKPTRLGIVVCDFLTEWFPNIMDTDFTSGMEESLDTIASGETEWVAVLEAFYEPFERQIEHTKSNAERVDSNALTEPTDEFCPECESPLVIRDGRYGKFISCSRFPECRHTRNIRVVADALCPRSAGELVQRRGRGRRSRPFWGCSHYPECDFSTSSTPVGEPCPNCGKLLVKDRDAARCIGDGTDADNPTCQWRGDLPVPNESGSEPNNRKSVEV